MAARKTTMDRLQELVLAGAAIDRLLHHAHVLVIEGDSYRNPSTNRRSRGNAKEARK